MTLYEELKARGLVAQITDEVTGMFPATTKR